MKKRIACALLTLALLFCLLPAGTAVAAKKHVSFPSACAFLYGGDGTIDYTNDRDFAVNIDFTYPDVLRSDEDQELAVAGSPEDVWDLAPGESFRIDLRFGSEGETPASGRYTGEIRWHEVNPGTGDSVEGTIALTVVVPDTEETNPVSVTVLGDPAKVSCTLWTSKDAIGDVINQSFADQGAVRITRGEAPVGWYVGLEITSRGAERVQVLMSYVRDDGENGGGDDGHDFSDYALLQKVTEKTGKGTVAFIVVVDPVRLTLDPNGAPGYAKSEALPGNWPAAVPDNPFTYDKYAFVSWNTKADSSGYGYMPGEEITLTQGTTFYAQWMEDPPGGGQNHTSFTGLVTYRSGKELYLQNEQRGFLALLDSGNAAEFMEEAQVGKMVTVSGEKTTLNQSGYHIPEVVDAMIFAVSSTTLTAAPVDAAIEQLNDDLMARLVRVKATKAEFTAANVQFDMADYADEQTLTVTGVLSANTRGRVLLGATVHADHLPGEPVRENEIPATCTEEGQYDEVVYCSVCHTELSRVRKPIPALGHEPGEPVRENEVPATAQTVGSYDEVVYCTRCGAELSREHRTTDKLPMDPPTIKTQPKNAAVKSGSKASFTVKAKGKELTYLWFARAGENEAWTAVEGATKATLAVVGTKDNNGTQYRCRVKNGGGEVYTDPVTLRVTLQPPTIKTQPKNVTVKSGAKAKFTVKASGKGLGYQWFSRPSADAEWTAVVGADKASCTVVGLTAISGSQYYCAVRNADGSVDSAIVTLTVTKGEPVIKTQPKNVKVKSGSKGKFTVKASGKNLSYKWFSRPNADAEWTEIAGETKATLNIVGSMDKNGWEFCCEVQNPDGKVRTNPAKLTVTPQAPKISTQPKDVKAKVGAKATFKVKASPKNVTYQWYYRTSETGEWIKIEGATSASYSFKVTEAQFGYQFRCLVRNADGEAWSNAATLIRK